MNGSNFTLIDTDAFNLFDSPNQTGTPERRLLLAMLERALLDYVGNDQREIDESEDWIFSDTASMNASAFSFPWVCSELDLNIDDIRGKIRQMPRRGKSRIAPWYITKGYQGKAQANEKKSIRSKVADKTVANQDEIKFAKAG